MGGPWRDRSYVPSVPTGDRPTMPDLSVLGGSQLGAYLAGIIIGMILGVIALWLAIPYLPIR